MAKKKEEKPQEVKETRIFTFELTEPEANLMVQSVARQPYDVVASLVAKIQGQAKQQIDNGTVRVVKV